jgi:tetratricopeptide (TPR) repeat protein
MARPILGAMLVAAFWIPLVPLSAITQDEPAPSSQNQMVNDLVKSAAEALRRGDYLGAIPLLEKLTAMSPNVAEFQADLGMAYYSTRHPQKAIAPCRQALRLKPSLVFAHYFLALSLSETGDCPGALPLLEKDYPRVEDPSLRRSVGLNGARCAMSVDDPDKAINFLQLLGRDFAKDPEVLYLRAHLFSELSTRASQQLFLDMPGSSQAGQIRAEILEMQGRIPEAIAEYRDILAKEPQLAGIHYQIGRLLLVGKRDPPTEDAARREFEEELQLNAADEGSEYELGEMAREARQWEEAIAHFRRAAKIDPRFYQALIGLGKSLISAARPAEAIEPLEKAARVAPGEAVAHYQLSFAYSHAGRGADAEKQMTIFRDIQERKEYDRQAIRQGGIGSISRPQTAEPPE